MAKGNIFNYERVRSPDMTEQMKLIDTAFAVGKPYTLTTSTTLKTTDLGKTIRVNADGNLTITFPAVGSDEDGGKIRIVTQGAGDVIVAVADGDAISTYSASTTATPVSDKATSDFAVAEYEYVDGITRWVAISHEGTWASA